MLSVLRSLTLPLLIVIASGSFSEASVTLIDQKISDIETLRKLSKKSETDALCGEITAVRGTYVCVFKKLEEMNKSLTRMGFFTGTATNFPKGTLISNNDSTLAEYIESISGHTVLGNDMESFYRVALSTNDSSKSVNDNESNVLNGFVKTNKIQSLGGQYAVIAFSNQSSDYKTVFNHEIYHAKYYLEPRFKTVIETFWRNNMSDDDKREIRLILGRFYNAKDEQIMIDEFQAYLLESNTKSNPLMKFAKKYKANLLQLLKQAGA